MNQPITLGLSEQWGGSPCRHYGYIARLRGPSLAPVIWRPHVYAQIDRQEESLWHLRIGWFMEPIDGPRDLANHRDKWGSIRLLLPSKQFPGPYPLGRWEGSYELEGSSVYIVVTNTTSTDKSLRSRRRGL